MPRFGALTRYGILTPFKRTLGDVTELGEEETVFFRTDTQVSDHSVTGPRQRAPYERSEYMETWLSGRKHLTANEAGSKSPPGFESLRLR